MVEGASGAAMSKPDLIKALLAFSLVMTNISGLAQASDHCGSMPTLVETDRCLHSGRVVSARQNDPENVDIWERCPTELFAVDADQGRISKEDYWNFSSAMVEGCAKEAEQRRVRRLEERRVQAQERAAAAAELAARVEAQKLCLRLTGQPCSVPSK